MGRAAYQGGIAVSAQPLSEELLSATDVRTLTGTANPDAQGRVLDEEGIPYRRRGRRILVSRFHTREWLAGRPVKPSQGINLSLVK
jgi:hypothetical protein